MPRRLLIVLALVVAAQVIPATVQATPYSGRHATHSLAALPSIPRLLALTWRGYKASFISADGRVMDPSRGAATTSEGQSYAMLRAVWMNDRREFDRVWTWTRNNLQVRGSDKLFGYLWGPKGAQWTILDPTSASDADQDIALALVLASHRWHSTAYLASARTVIRDIWRIEVGQLRGKPYLTAGNWAQTQDPRGFVVNPSYFAPYAYRIFARIDPHDRWLQLVKTSYHVLSACSRNHLGSLTSADLPPNWCLIQRASGKVAPVNDIANADTYGYDAFRAMWRVALDYLWFKSRAARSYLEKSSFLRRQWQQTARLFEEYTHTGQVQTALEDPTVYGGDLGNFIVTDRAAALAIAQTKLLPAFTSQALGGYWGTTTNYYEQNWVWFGLAMLAGRLPNLAR